MNHSPLFRSMLKKLLNKLFIYKRLAAFVHVLLVKINPTIEMKRVYKATMGKIPNLENPINLIEKIYWLQLHTDTSLWTECSDKYRMRDYVTKCGYEKNLPKLYGKWDKAEDIDFSILPTTFVLKTNNGCAQCIIVKDKREIDFKEVVDKLNKWIKVPYGFSGAQLHYTRIKPCIIAEELLVQSSEMQKISPKSIIDYKLWCFEGRPESFFVGYNRTPENLSIALYDTDWNDLSNNINSNDLDTYHSNVIIPRPKCLNEMLTIASCLSKPFPEVRVDFYEIDGKPIIGELTFTTGYGYFTEDYYNYLGSKIDLSKVKRIK